MQRKWEGPGEAAGSHSMSSFLPRLHKDNTESDKTQNQLNKHFGGQEQWPSTCCSSKGPLKDLMPPGFHRYLQTTCVYPHADIHTHPELRIPGGWPQKTKWTCVGLLMGLRTRAWVTVHEASLCRHSVKELECHAQRSFAYSATKLRGISQKRFRMTMSLVECWAYKFLCHIPTTVRLKSQ